jgi:uncharacterized RDD family membrane protein YckC
MISPTENLLTEIEQELSLEPASYRLRFGNFIIDTLVFYALLFLSGMALGIIMVAVNGSYDISENKSTQLLYYLINILVYFAYYSLMEGLTGGRTIGKFITGTRVIKTNGEKIGMKQAMIRSLSRLVPFEAISCAIGAFWHDRWSGTMVVKK